MKRLLAIGLLLLTSALVSSQEASGILSDPSAFRDAVDLQISLGDLDRAVGDQALLERIAQRVLILDGIASSISVFSEEPADFYIEIELVTGSWNGVEDVDMHRAFVIVDDPVFAGRIAERQGREPDPALIVRTDRILVAGQLVTLAEAPDGEIVPVIRALDIRRAR